MLTFAACLWHGCRTQLVADMKLDFMLNKESRKQNANANQERQRLVSDDTIYGHSSKLWEEAKAQMVRGSYQPVLDPATLHCLKELPWWRES